MTILLLVKDSGVPLYIITKLTGSTEQNRVRQLRFGVPHQGYVPKIIIQKLKIKKFGSKKYIFDIT